MELRIDHASISQSIEQLGELEQVSRIEGQNASFSSINGSYSSVSGLDQLGGGHGQVINGGTGSAHVVLASYAEQIEWLKNALKASVEALNEQDELFARGMDIADTGGKVGEESVVFPQRPAPRFESFSFVSPRVKAPSSLDELSRDFSGTNSGAVSAAQSSWTTMASTISEVSVSLERIAGDLLETNAGEVFEQASLRITEVAQAGSTFSQNAREMARSVGTLNQIYMGNKMQVLMAALSISLIKEPAERAAAEKSFLASFESSFQSDVQAGVPGIDNLMQINGADGSGGDIALGMANIAGSGESFSTQGLVPQGFTGGGGGGAGSGMGAAPAGAGSFGTVTDNLEGMDVSDLQTTAASIGGGMASPTMGGISGLGGGGAGMGGGSGAAGMGGGIMGGPMMGTTGRNGVAGGAPRISNAGLSPLMNARTQSASAMGGMPPMMGAGGAAAGAGGANGGVTGLSGARGTNAKQPLSNSSGVAHSAGGLSSGGVAGGKSQAGMQRSMMPMMPMAGGGAGAGNQKNTGKVKSVTSAVEEDTNIAALLGDRGPVVPGVIGDWVRG